MNSLVPRSRTRLVLRKAGIRVLANELRKAKKDYILDCGCRLKAGMSYHAIVALKDGKVAVKRNHIIGCLEAVH